MPASTKALLSLEYYTDVRGTTACYLIEFP